MLQLASSHAWTQATPAKKEPELKEPDVYMVHKIVFDGKTPYSQEALEQAAGLKVEAQISSQDLQAAAERLISTGAFGDVGATVDGPRKSVSVIFKVTPVDQVHMLPVSFDNFVWFSREQLAAEVQSRVPLFNGLIPEGGTVQEAVQEALQQMLSAKGVKAEVATQLVAPYPGHPLRMAEYHVQKPDVKLHALELEGVPPAFARATATVKQDLIGMPYDDGLIVGFRDRILEDYRDAGYQEAALTGVRTTIVAASATRVDVDVKVTVHAGEQYRLSQLTWAGSPQMSVEAFRAAAKLRPGDIASQKAVNYSLEALDAAYRRQGYADVIVDAKPKLDPVAHLVSYTVTADPGTQYKLRDLRVAGLTLEQRREFDAAWKLHPGDVYNGIYVRSFLLNNSDLPTLKTMAARFNVLEEPESGLLDLDITFRKNSGL